MKKCFKYYRENAAKFGVIEIDEKFFRKEKDGSLLELRMFDPIFGWLTDDELFDLRQKEPRIAP